LLFSSFPGDAKHRTWNLELPGSRFACPGTTASYAATLALNLSSVIVRQSGRGRQVAQAYPTFRGV